ESHSRSDSDSCDSSIERKKKKEKKKKRKFQKDSDSESDSSYSSVEKKKRYLKKEKEKKSKKERKHHCRQRVSEPSEVVRRYKTVLGIFQKGKTMAEAFHKFGVDRNPISQTAAIAELALAAPENICRACSTGEGEKLSDIAKECRGAVEADEETSEAIRKMKDNNDLLPMRNN
ncbi:coiled-coil domain-containing protein 106-like, partial [Sebastes umbrosus]|uniref:coiled-coil domain-containing protein 106-like n=1 Tax=Sebastes umbrosus TaxID=72105 RepID=UPI00189FE2CD